MEPFLTTLVVAIVAGFGLRVGWGCAGLIWSGLTEYWRSR